ncbi:MAG: hypothetical protein ACE5HJ_07160 [Thermoplasmata archaeon]
MALDVRVGWHIGQAPVVTTEAATDITEGEVVLNGVLTDLGDVAVVTLSFEWGSSPALSQATSSQETNVTGAFQAFLTDLDPDTQYYFRAKATGNGTSVGDTLTFRTATASTTLDDFLQFWPYIIVIVAGVAVVALLLLRRYLPAAQAEDELILKALFLNKKGQLLKELNLGGDGVDLGYRQLLKLLVGKGLVKVETVKSDKYYVHFLHRDDVHMASVSLSSSRNKVLRRANSLFEDVKDEL